MKIVLLFVVLTLSSCSLTTNQLRQTTQQNATVVAEVKSALISDDAVDAAAIQLSVVNGSLKIEGFVASEEESQRVLEIAEQVVGDMASINLLEVR